MHSQYSSIITDIVIIVGELHKTIIGSYLSSPILIDPSPIPQVISISSCISASQKAGRWRLALELLRRAEALRIDGNRVTFNAAMAAVARGFWAFQNGGRKVGPSGYVKIAVEDGLVMSKIAIDGP